MRKKADPFLNETMSEIADDQEKRAVFDHSLRDGVFNDIKNSPLKDKLPRSLRVYEPFQKNRVFEKEINNLKRQTDGELLNQRLKSPGDELARTQKENFLKST